LPQQARSTELVATIMEAATHVLRKEGATRFTTARVADRAGVSVGSVCQYFSNNAAILFRLQADECQRAAGVRIVRSCNDTKWRDRMTNLTWLAQAPYINCTLPHKKRPPYSLSWEEQRLMFDELQPHS
jgi:AcrR family transcriptional regulator